MTRGEQQWDSVPSLPHNPFTRFVHELGRQPLAHPILHELQVQHGLNKNLTLCVIWFASAKKGRLNKSQLQRLLGVLQPWHDKIVATLQRLQQQLLNMGSTRATRIKPWVTVEVQLADQIEQHLLASALSHCASSERSMSRRLADACHNLALYCKNRQVYLADATQQGIATLLQSIFSDCTLGEVEQQLTQAFSRAQLEEGVGAQLELMSAHP